MKNIIIVIGLCLIGNFANSQTYGVDPKWGTEHYRSNSLVSMGLPRDTFVIAADKQRYPHLAVKQTVLYLWDTTAKKWNAYSGGLSSLKNRGTGFRIGKNDSLQSLYAGFGIKKDTSTNNGITDLVDTSRGKIPTYYFIDSLKRADKGRTGFYLNANKTFLHRNPIVYGTNFLFTGNSWAREAYTSGTPWPTQLTNYFSKTKVINAVDGDDINALIFRNWSVIKSMGSDSINFVDLAYVPVLGYSHIGPTYLDVKDKAKTYNYIQSGYRSYIANYYLDADTFSVSSLADANYRNATAADSLGSKSVIGSIGLGAFSFTKPAGKTSLVIGTYLADGIRTNQGTVVVTLDGVEYYRRNLDSTNNAPQGNGKVIKKGLSYEAIVLKNIPTASATVVVTASGDSTRFDYVGYLQKFEDVVKPLFINNIPYGGSWNFYAVPKDVIDTSNLAMQDAVAEFINYPVYLTNSNGFIDSLVHVNGGHPSSAGNDIIAEVYKKNLIAAIKKPDVSTNLSVDVPISSLKPATANNDIDNFQYQQKWRWTGSFSGTSGGMLALNTTSTDLSSGSSLMTLDLSGTNINTSDTVYGIKIINNHKWGTKVAGYFSSTNTGTNVAIAVPSGGGNIGFGTTTPTALLDVAGKIKTSTFQLTTGATNGYVLTSDASGNATWQAGGGGSGVTTMAAIGSTPNANGATISGSTLNLQPASTSFGGVVTTGTQSFAGNKTFTGTVGIQAPSGNTTFTMTSPNGSYVRTTTYDNSAYLIDNISAGAWFIRVAGNGVLSMDGSNNIFNNGQLNQTTRIATQGGANSLYVQGTTGNVGISNGSPTTALHTTAFATGYAAKTATYTLTATDHTIECTANTFTVTLPTAASISGRQYTITNSGSGTITIATTSSQTFANINATPTTLTLAPVGAGAIVSYTVTSNGTNWIVTGKVKNE